MYKIITLLALLSLFFLSACEDMKMDKNVSQETTLQ